MVTRYRRSFSHQESPLRARGMGGATLLVRMRELRVHARRRVWTAMLASLVLHVVGAWLLRDTAARPPFLAPTIGFEEGTAVPRIAPVQQNVPVRERASAPARAGGSLSAILVGEIVDPEPVAVPDPVAPRERPRREERRPFAQPAPNAPVPDPVEAPIRVQLREDWSVDPGSPAAAYSNRFRPVHVVVPKYPPLAVEQDIEGLVTIEADVDTNGKVTGVRVLSSPDGGLALAASQALLLWEFHPLDVDGKKRGFKIVVPFRFRIARGP